MNLCIAWNFSVDIPKVINPLKFELYIHGNILSTAAAFSFFEECRVGRMESLY
jgi:hypothetical protein